MEKIICGVCFSKKKFKTLLKKIEWIKFSVKIFFKVQTTSERKLNGEISIQNGDFSDFEWRELFVEFVFQ